MNNFKRQIIKVDLQKIENKKRSFEILSNNLNQFKLDIINNTNTAISLADAVEYVEDIKTLRQLFEEIQKSAIRKRAEKQGVTLNELEQLENIELNKQQLRILDTAKNLKQSLLFQGMGKAEWLIDGEIIMNDKVEQVITEACTLYTKNELENSRLEVLKIYKKHLELNKYDKTVMLRILGNNNPESFIGFQSR